MKLVIVESPTKAKTISRFLGKPYRVESSYGHIRDLPPKKLGIDVKNNFLPTYQIAPEAKKRVATLRKMTEGAQCVILATDEDREGEAIAWHLVQALGLKTQISEHEEWNAKQKAGSKSQAPSPKLQAPGIKRIVFHEITKRAIEEALNNTRSIDMKLVDAQQARRILDRLVGYKLSPFLWKKVMRGLSAGRVQSVAVRLIVDREEEIGRFTSKEYWTIEAYLHSLNVRDHPFVARLYAKKGETLEKLAIPSQNAAEAIVKDLTGASYRVARIEIKSVQKYPFPPYTTSTLQQDAWRRLRFSAKQTMRTAQSLYEGVEVGEEGSVGLITYMRTDSVHLSLESTAAARAFIEKEFGREYLPPTARAYKTKAKGAQEAHEAIRPTNPARAPEQIKPHATPEEYKLYSLVWSRFIACQMRAALFDATTADIAANDYTFRATGQVKRFDGFLTVYPIKSEDILLPPLKEQETLTLEKLEPKQHFTQPPPRYTEASLVKTLEENGIGRPSTYAPIMSTIQERGYVIKNEEKRFLPTETGIHVTKLLVDHFPNIVDISFTAHMEKDLDEIACGKADLVPVVRSFYEPFEKNLREKYESVAKNKISKDTPTGEKCPNCGKELLVKMGRFGKFIGCSGYPECTFTKQLIKSTGVPCPSCKRGEIIERRSKRGKIFYGCSAYPECSYALWDKPTGDTCQKCGSLIIETKKEGKKCSNGTCGSL